MSNISEIFDRCIKNTATDAERTFFYEWAEEPENRVLAMKLLENAFSDADRSLDMNAESGEAMIQAILLSDKNISAVPQAASPYRVHFLRTAWFRYAAAIILVVCSGFYFWSRNSHDQTLTSKNNYLPEDIAPGKEGAVLTLADGTQVVLDSLGNGVIATQNGSQAVLNNGQLTYTSTKDGGAAMMYNTMTTPKGRQFNVILPDGTKVWLNAASSIRYPTRFGSTKRMVEITGEAYFEVAKNPKQPFFVETNNLAAIEVLGTSFNVNAYEDEASINTTLLSGGVRVIRYQLAGTTDKYAESTLLQPGQQAQIPVDQVDIKPGQGNNTQPGIKIINKADTDKVMAWRRGFFNFQDLSLQDIMKQLERWYDIEVEYKKGIPDLHFIGELSRDINLADLLKVLEESKVHFRMEENRKLVVYP